MKTTNEIILEASLKVFSNKGYVSATTIAISKEAGVSEMTLFRHFKTKNNLFLTTIKKAMGESLTDDSTINLKITLKEFISNLLDEKLKLISKNILLVKMLIRESLSKTLPKELEFTKVIYNQVVKRISYYTNEHKLSMNATALAELIVGILLRYAIMEDNPKYDKLDKIKQDEYLNNYLKILNM